MNWSERDKAVVWHPFTQMKTAGNAIAIVKGEGAYLYDEAGNRYIDGISSWWVNTHGHSHPYIAQKAAEQLTTLEHVIFAGFTHPKAVELAERVLQKLPNNQQRVFYSDNGSTAVEVAIKMAFQYWYNQEVPKKKVIALEGAYHGDTFGAMSVSGRSPFTDPYGHYLFDVEFIPVPTRENEQESLKQLQTLLEGGDVGAFIFEPLLQGSGGMVMYSPEVLDAMIALCRKHQVLTIADEVMTGFGRTGRFFASDYLQHKPDLFALSKGLTGGTMALSVTTCTQQVYEAFLSDDKKKTFFHGHSFTANPVACAVACASLDLFEEEATWNNIRRIEARHQSFAATLEGNAKLRDVRQLGTVLAIEFNTSESTSYFNAFRDKIYDFFQQKGLVLRPLGNVLYVLPPYCISDDDLSLIYKAIASFIEEMI